MDRLLASTQTLMVEQAHQRLITHTGVKQKAPQLLTGLYSGNLFINAR